MKNNRKNLESIIFIGFIVLSIILNILTNKNSPVVGVFALFYGLLILKLFKEDSFKDKIYFLTILFSFLSFTFLLKVNGRYDIYFYFISTLVYLLLMVKDYKKYKMGSLFKNKYVKFLIAFVIYMAASVLWSIDKSQAIKSIFNYGLMISLLIVVVDYNIKSNNIAKTMKYILYVVPGIVLMGLIEITGYRFNIRNHYIDENLYRLAPDFLMKIPTTLFYSPNNYGVFIVLVMTFLFMAILYTKKKWLKITSGVLYLLLQINLIFTTSRTAWISLLIIYSFAAAVFLFFKKRNQFKKTLYFAAITIAIFYAISLIPFMGQYYGKMTATTMPQYGEIGSTNVRYTLIINIVDGVVMKGHPLGFGAGNTANFLKTFNNTNGITNAHSLWFEILGDFGIPMFILFAVFYLLIMYELLKKFLKESSLKVYAAALLFSFFGFAFLSFAPSSVITFTPFWILMGLGISTVNNTWEVSNENIDTLKLVP